MQCHRNIIITRHLVTSGYSYLDSEDCQSCHYDIFFFCDIEKVRYCTPNSLVRRPLLVWICNKVTVPILYDPMDSTIVNLCAYSSHKGLVVYVTGVECVCCCGIANYKWALSMLIPMANGPSIYSSTHLKC